MKEEEYLGVPYIWILDKEVRVGQNGNTNFFFFVFFRGTRNEETSRVKVDREPSSTINQPSVS